LGFAGQSVIASSTSRKRTLLLLMLKLDSYIVIMIQAGRRACSVLNVAANKTVRAPRHSSFGHGETTTSRRGSRSRRTRRTVIKTTGRQRAAGGENFEVVRSNSATNAVGFAPSRCHACHTLHCRQPYAHTHRLQHAVHQQLPALPLGPCRAMRLTEHV
jgi:hypothetical protein